MSHRTVCRGGRILNVLPRTRVVFYTGLHHATSPAMEATNATAQGALHPIEEDITVMHRA
jgi:hypothetical protein